MPNLRKNFDLNPRRHSQVVSGDWSFVVMPDQKFIATEKKKRSKWALAPFVSVVLVLVILLQSVVYLSRAHSAQGEILGAATSAYSDLSSAGTSLTNQNFSGAQTQFDSALTSLQSAQGQLDQFKALQLVAPEAKSADHILAGASDLAQAGKNITDALGIFDDLKITSAGVNTTGLTDKLAGNQDSLNSALFLLKQAQSEFDQVSGLPASYNDTLTSARDQVNLLTGMITNLINLEGIYLGFFGQGPKVYLLVFQNPDEARATGGFLGTYGVLKINDGQIQDLKIDSIYDLDGQIYSRVAAPGPFQPDIKKWGIRDANWFADFPTSAQKLLQFFEQGEETADGVIALTPNIFEDLLNLTGPIAMPKYGVTLSADNFQSIVQFKTSVDYDRVANDPKQMLADFAPVLLDHLASLDKQNWLGLLQIMEDNLNQKQILLYSKDPKVEQNIDALKVSGRILPSDQDYLDIVNSNLGGTKTDLEVAQTAALDAKILSDGTIIDTVTISRYNSSSAANKDFMRVLVPLGSTLISSVGFDPGTFNPSTSDGLATDPDLANWDQGQQFDAETFVRTESGKTEFTGWLDLDGGATKTLKLIYAIPYKASTNLLDSNAVYSLLFQKQDGTKAYNFSASLTADPLTPTWLSQDASFASGKINFSYTTSSDEYWAALLTK